MSAWACGSCGGENPEGMRFCGHCGAASTAEPAAPSAADAIRSFVAASVADRIVEEGGQIEEERRLITALFADISGFTPLADRLDPEELLEVIDPVVSGLSTVVGRYDGFVEKFAGDALLALFGAPVSHEDDADRALLVALEMHRELALICERLGDVADGLTLHVGVNSGHGIARLIGSSVRTDYGVLGDSVILAQRLESAAPPGETYVSESTRRLTAARFEFEPVGELTLKGKAEPVVAWRLVGERRGTERRGRRVFGRERELATLEVALGRAAAGSAGALAIVGEPGVGKSTLLQAARLRAATTDVRWVAARCLSYGASLPYWPLADLLRREAGIDAETANDVALARLGETLVASPPDVAVVAQFLGLRPAAPPELEPEAFRRRLEAALVGWLQTLGSQGGAVLAIEDVHWIDAPTLDVVAQVARAQPGGMLLLLSARPEARETIAALGAEALEVGRLAEDAVTALIESTLGGTPPRGLVEFVVRRADGNPFFVEELVQALRDRDALVLDGERWAMRPGWDSRELPPTVEEVLSARIDLLPHRAADVLAAAAVIGRRVRTPLLGDVAGADAAAELDHLVSSGFLDRIGEDEVEFHHALVQDVAYGRLLRKRRRDLHMRVAEAAEALYGARDDTIDLLARHRYLAGAPDAREYLMRAGRRARRLYANHEAILHLERALELAPADDEIRLELGRLYELVGGYDAALLHYTAARDAAPSVAAWRGVASVLRTRGDYDSALQTVDAAFADEALRGQDLTPLWLEQTWALVTSGRLDAAVDVGHAGLAASGGRRTTAVGELLAQLANAESIQGHADDAVTHAREAYELFVENDDLAGRAFALRVLGDIYRLAGHLEEASATLQEALALAERVGSSEELGGSLLNLGAIEFERGDVRAAIRLTERAAEEFERIDHASGRAWAYSNLAWLYGAAGEFEEAALRAEASLAYAQETQHTIVVAETLDTTSYIALETGDTARAALVAEQAAAAFLEMGMQPKAREALERAADAWTRQGESERARQTLERARSLTAVT